MIQSTITTVTVSATAAPDQLQDEYDRDLAQVLPRTASDAPVAINQDAVQATVEALETYHPEAVAHQDVHRSYPAEPGLFLDGWEATGGALTNRGLTLGLVDPDVDVEGRIFVHADGAAEFLTGAATRAHLHGVDGIESDYADEATGDSVTSLRARVEDDALAIVGSLGRAPGVDPRVRAWVRDRLPELF